MCRRRDTRNALPLVMPGLDPGIHVFAPLLLLARFDGARQARDAAARDHLRRRGRDQLVAELSGDDGLLFFDVAVTISGQ
jgi:hypothetical protein